MTIPDFHKTSHLHCNLDKTKLKTTCDPESLFLENITKTFGDKPVLKGINLSIKQHEFIAVLGKSGCGKSTLLRILGGLEQPDSGRILKDGKPYQPDETRIMFQEPRLLPWLDLVGNVALALPGNANKEKARSIACDILQRVGLGDKLTEWPLNLSGGQKQRVALARALICTPQILAFDEPLGALDALTRLGMQRLLEQIWSENQFTAVLVTHDVSEAILLADRVIVIKDGIITQNISVDIPRPRKPGSHISSALERDLLEQLLEDEAQYA